jgi:DNA-directed RNA polymerase specialized sigma24 family protein
MFGLPPEELMSVGRVAAMEAERSWEPGGGRSLSSWIYLNVEVSVRRALVSAGRYAAEEDEPADHEPEPEARYLIREALDYLEARLPREDWVLLWLHHAEGQNCSELAHTWGIGHAAMRQRISRARRKAVTLWRLAA